MILLSLGREIEDVYILITLIFFNEMQAKNKMIGRISKRKRE